MNLSKGLLIENQNILLPWGISNEEAWKIGNPVSESNPQDRTRMRWTNVAALDGLNCDISAWFETSEVKLHAVSLVDTQKRPYKEWEKILTEHCRKLFGKQEYEGFWTYEDFLIQLRYDLRFVEAVWLKITNINVPCKYCEADEAMRKQHRKKVNL